MPIPKAIRNAPSLWLGLELYLEGWLDLNTCRSHGMDMGPIPWLAVHEYANQHELDSDQRETLHHHIVAMDRVYESWREKKRKAGRGSKSVQQAHKGNRSNRRTTR